MFRKILCFIGWHRWTASLEDYIEEFGFVPFNKICSKSVCEFCGTKYNKDNQ